MKKIREMRNDMLIPTKKKLSPNLFLLASKRLTPFTACLPFKFDTIKKYVIAKRGKRSQWNRAKILINQSESILYIFIEIEFIQ